MTGVQTCALPIFIKSNIAKQSTWKETGVSGSDYYYVIDCLKHLTTKPKVIYDNLVWYNALSVKKDSGE